MLWLTGLLGILAIGSVAFLEFSKAKDPDGSAENQEDEEEDPELGDFRAALDDLNTERVKLVPVDIDEQAHRHYENMSRQKTGPVAVPRAVTDAVVAERQSPPEDRDAQMMKDWLTDAATDELSEFDAETEDLVLVWDDNDHDTPEVVLVESPDNPDVTDVYVNGLCLAQIPAGQGLSVENIILVPLSTAVDVGWAHG